MKTTLKTISVCILALCLLCACLPLSVFALPVVCGDSVSRRYDPETDSIIFYGTGPMFDFGADPDHTPETFDRVVIEAGITYIGSFLFDSDSIGELVLPDTPLSSTRTRFSAARSSV